MSDREARMAARDVVHVFSNGEEYLFWYAHNCDRCRKQYDNEAHDWRCPIEKALDASKWDADTGMDREMAIRGGLAEWPHRACPEFERDWSVA